MKQIPDGALLTTISPVILCGGSGTRMWPLSRENYPKQFLDLMGQRSLLQDTVVRVEAIPNVAATMLLCNHEHRFITGDQLANLPARDRRIVIEPVARNTAPAICAAAVLIAKASPDALMLVLPSDHVVKNDAAFIEAIQQAIPPATAGKIVTFGLTPTDPHTGYGYIRADKLYLGSESIRLVDKFVEKPNELEAKELLRSGNHYWNGGIFLFKAASIIDEFRTLAPDVLDSVQRSVDFGTSDKDFLRLCADNFSKAADVSIDYAVMEKTPNAVMVIADNLGWSDIGSWTSLADESTTDEFGNHVRGDAIVMDSSNTYVRAEHRLVTVLGANNLIVVETPDAVLVADRRSAQDVRKLVAILRAKKRAESMFHRRVNRPWGSYEGIDTGERFQVKRIVVKPGARLSLQMHYHRAEHWIVVKGTARVTNGECVKLLAENESTYIPLGKTHRLENPGRIPLELIEVQSGTYLGEDDIVRFEDHYGRDVADNG